MVKSTEDENNMWEHIENELLEIRVEILNYDHPLHNRILDDVSELYQKKYVKISGKIVIRSNTKISILILITILVHKILLAGVKRFFFHMTRESWK